MCGLLRLHSQTSAAETAAGKTVYHPSCTHPDLWTEWCGKVHSTGSSSALKSLRSLKGLLHLFCGGVRVLPQNERPWVLTFKYLCVKAQCLFNAVLLLPLMCKKGLEINQLNKYQLKEYSTAPSTTSATYVQSPQRVISVFLYCTE